MQYKYNTYYTQVLASVGILSRATVHRFSATDCIFRFFFSSKRSDHVRATTLSLKTALCSWKRVSNTFAGIPQRNRHVLISRYEANVTTHEPNRRRFELSVVCIVLFAFQQGRDFSVKRSRGSIQEVERAGSLESRCLTVDAKYFVCVLFDDDGGDSVTCCTVCG